MKSLLAVGVVLMAGTGYAQQMAPETFRSIYSSKDVTLSTDPRTAFWRGAAPVIADRDTEGQVVVNHRTEIRSRWTNDSLYLLFVCPYEELYLKPNPNIKEETYELWNWDVAEVFLGSNFKDIRRYKEFEISPQGEWIDLDVDLSLPHHEVGWTWNSGFAVSAKIDRKRKIWYGAMRIPFASIISQAPTEGTILRANLFRSQGPPNHRKEIAWKPPLSSTFHTPERFGRLELTKVK
jgi:hypothetical protein